MNAYTLYNRYKDKFNHSNYPKTLDEFNCFCDIFMDFNDNSLAYGAFGGIANDNSNLAKLVNYCTKKGGIKVVGDEKFIYYDDVDFNELRSNACENVIALADYIQSNTDSLNKVRLILSINQPKISDTVANELHNKFFKNVERQEEFIEDIWAGFDISSDEQRERMPDKNLLTI